MCEINSFRSTLFDNLLRFGQKDPNRIISIDIDNEISKKIVVESNNNVTSVDICGMYMFANDSRWCAHQINLACKKISDDKNDQRYSRWNEASHKELCVEFRMNTPRSRCFP